MALISRFKKKLKEAEDLGFGTKIIGEDYRLMEKDGRYNVTTIGNKDMTLYQDLVEMSWANFFGIVVLFFLVVNGFFALLLLTSGPECLNGMEDQGLYMNFADAWFFSVQTLTTVGYGSVSPMCMSSNIIASVISLTGLLTFALVTGLFFARFSKPKAQFIFSENAIIAPFPETGTGFMLRMANKRDNHVINLEAKLVSSWVGDDGKGNRTRQYKGLDLQLDKVTMLPLSWTIVHPIDKKSPLYGLGAEKLLEKNFEVIVLMQGYDETFAQEVHANFSYTAQEILCGFKFNMMYYPGPDGKTVLNLDKINDMEKVG